MSEKCQVASTCDLNEIREAVCIHTNKICDACIDKDCIEDLRVYLTRESQSILDRASSAKARSAELLHVYLDVEPIAYNSGHYSVDITYYYRVIADAMIGGVRPSTIYGLAVFTKRVILCGGEGGAKIYSSCTVLDGLDPQSMMKRNLPKAVVEVVDPMILAGKVLDVCDCCRTDCELVDLPSCICGCFDDELVLSGEAKRLYVTIGQFSIIRLERDTQLLMPAFDYCIPSKECSAVSGDTDTSPCDVFSQIEFPMDTFFPPCGCNSTSNGNTNNNCGCNSCGYRTCGG